MKLVSRLWILLLACASPGIVRANDFAKGADVGWLQQMEASGFVFRDAKGISKDCLQILKEHGINTIRLRVWVNPSQHPINGHCSPQEVVVMAKRASAMGFRILIDFHYSDSWADPGKQKKPAAWADHSFEELKKDVYAHTFDVMKALRDQRVFAEWVQVGNEIPDGMLWPDGKMDQPKNLSELINAGYQAVKTVSPKTKVIVHLDHGNNNELYRYFFDALKLHGAKYDVIGMSYYPYWLKEDYTKSIKSLEENLNDVAKRYGKEVMIVEVGGEDTQPENTREMLSAVLKTVRAVPQNKGLGVVYWEPQGAASWSKYKLSTWREDGRPTSALGAFLEEKSPAR